MAVINRISWVFGLLLTTQMVSAAVLPEDRVDLLFHSYDGGGVEITGPSVLIRKKFGEHLSTTYNHYVDNVTSASVDVVTTASPYTEVREENSLQLDYLNEKTLMSLGYAQSEESDFDAGTLSFNISQDFFGDLSTLSLGYSRGDNTVRNSTNSSFNRDVVTRNYRTSLSQVITKKFLMSFVLEIMSDEGYLNNPYRSVRYLDDTVSKGYSYQSEVYPNTRSTNAVALRGRYFWAQRTALYGGYRLFSGTWGVDALTYEMGFTLPYEDNWTLEFSYRFYDQTKAEFYSDLFQTSDELIFLARDKELSSFSSQTIGIGASYEFKKNGSGLIKKGSLSFNYDYMQFDYRDFRDLTVSGANPGEEPLYNFNAGIIRLFASFWF